MVFDRCKTFFLQRHRDAPQTDRPWGLSPLESLLSGSVAGICSAACTYPLDMTRAQLAVLKSKKHAHNIGFVGILIKNYKERVSAFVCASFVFVLVIFLVAFAMFGFVALYILVLLMPLTLGTRGIVQRHHTYPPGNTPVRWYCFHLERTSETTDTKFDRS